MVRRLAAASVFLAAFLPEAALAHGGQHPLGTSGIGWSFAPLIVAPLAASAILYACGTLRLWRRAGIGRGVRYRQAAAFWSGWAALVLALVSPLHELGEHLFAAHMVEHEILMVVAAPLLVLARPGAAMLWALPARLRASFGGIERRPPVAASWRALTDPCLATVLHGAALWIWHVPILYSAVLTNSLVHWLQHISFLATALLFWWALLFGRARVRGYGAAVGYLFATALHTSLLGALLVVSRTAWYAGQGAFASAFGLTILEDQQIAGLIMWVPAGFVYAGAALAFAGIWIARSETRSDPGGALA
jgi:cytochrome c oxidase assembly factor CtaG